MWDVHIVAKQRHEDLLRRSAHRGLVAQAKAAVAARHLAGQAGWIGRVVAATTAARQQTGQADQASQAEAITTVARQQTGQADQASQAEATAMAARQPADGAGLVSPAEAATPAARQPADGAGQVEAAPARVRARRALGFALVQAGLWVLVGPGGRRPFEQLAWHTERETARASESHRT